MKTRVGTVEAVWRFPVKSMLGQEVSGAEVNERGLYGDRLFALVDETGKVASAKSPRRWAGLLDCQAAFLSEPKPGETGPIVCITLPDGTLVRSDQADCNDLLSNWLGRPVRLEAGQPDREQIYKYEADYPDVEGLLVRNKVIEAPVSGGAPPGTFFNYASIHLLTTASLGKLQRLSPGSAITGPRFRPNIIVDTGEVEPEFVENAWMGRHLRIGEKVRLRATVTCPRCVLPTLSQNHGAVPKDEKILRAIAWHNRVDLGWAGVQPSLGIYAEVNVGGIIRPGDLVRLED